MNNILFFLTPKAMCAYVYDDHTLRQALEKMESAGFAALPILNRRGEYRGTLTEPLYRLLPDGTISDGTHEIGHSFFREYKFKLEKLYDRFLTKRGAELAKERQAIAQAFYESLYREVNNGYTAGKDALSAILEK